MAKKQKEELLNIENEEASKLEKAEKSAKKKDKKEPKPKKKKPYGIYCTGDIHGDLERFEEKKIKKLKKNDILLVCGDFGFIWKGTKKEKRILKRLGKKKYHILFVEGCHENYDLLYNYPLEDYMGGKCRTIYGNLRCLARGSIFDFDGVRIFTFGGGQTYDEDWRRSMGTVWKQEMPEMEEIEEGIENLKRNKNEVDFIVTHEPPSGIRDFIGEGLSDILRRNQLSAAFDEIAANTKFKCWFFGKCHRNKVVSPKYRALFGDVVMLKSRKSKKK